MKINAFYQRYNMTQGESPLLVIEDKHAESWYGRDPFEDNWVEGVSLNLMTDPNGTTDGHNVMFDSTFMDGIRVDKDVPLSPLFVKDLCGRAVYVGFGPERKSNTEWAAYRLPDDAPEDLKNPFVPLCVFPRFCRDVAPMEGQDLLEHVFLTKFRCLEMSAGFNGRISGAGEDDPLVNAIYPGANLYPYKLRLDTFYTDGYKLPQTQLVYARGLHEGVNPASAKAMADQWMGQWQARPAGMTYADWLESLGEDAVEALYQAGCTVIPTYDACNGYHVVGRDFGLEDYWPGRAVLGLHDVMEERADKSPIGTILEVLEPGYVTATMVYPAKVVVSDGSGYVSPNAVDPLPLVPNLNLPHPRVIDSWRATWLPTHPEHFEVPAIWGWEPTTGRFMQMHGPLWDPLHYYYESVPQVLAAFERTPLAGRVGLVPVPDEMLNRFFPVVPMQGFDTFSDAEFQRRLGKSVLPLNCVKHVQASDFMCGIGYHPMPAEYEFELDPFWFPELHPLNRDQGAIPIDLDLRIVPVIYPRVTMTVFKASVDAPEGVDWWADEALMATPDADPMVNYPYLARYLMGDMNLVEVLGLCPMPYLGNPGERIALPAPGWWLDEEEQQLDGPLALDELVPGVHDALWDMRQKGVELVQFRHLIYRGNLPLYMLAWWYGWDFDRLKTAVEEWIKEPENGEDPLSNIVHGI